jgi:hypothetical protein
MASQTETKLQALLARTNPSIDFTDPIVRDTVITFPANIIDDVDSRIASIQVKFSNAALGNMTDTELDRFAYQTRGMVRKPGFYASGYVYVMATGLGEDVSIPAGTTFSTSDGAWQFYSTDPLYVRAENLSAFYNAVRGAYEFRVPVQASNAGTDYNVAAYRISNIRSALSFAARVENRDAFTQGKNQESKADFIDRIGLDTAGFSVNAAEAVRNAIMTAVPGVSDCFFTKPHQDANKVIIHYIGRRVVSTILEGSTGSNPSRIVNFSPSQTPVKYVEAVVLNGEALNPQDYTYDSFRLAFSPSIVLSPNAGYTISFQYNGIGDDINSFMSATADVHQTQWVPKEAKAVALPIKVAVRMPSFMPASDVSDLVTNAVITAINQGKFVSTLSANALAQSVMSESSDILECRITFDGAVFTTFDPGTYPTTSSDLISVVDL